MLKEGMNPGDIGTEMATVVVLRQLYRLMAELHGVDKAGVAAWRDEIRREIQSAMTGRLQSHVAILEGADELVTGVFHGIANP
ncbi:hypothetical protein [Ancylobacter lacus]|uniref:hypothetical protein n=1 Tax=Ancylobacter lacus TaxID=2579970 RepID=UPI001BCDA6A5|nr:hypothetical protein [Ancylobacter lacus]MBS7539738.1 hypothetical protein [Ancylobacter lacus]